jgi:hypothetical protein
MAKRWTIFGLIVGVLGMFVWVVLRRIAAPFPDPTCDSADLLSSHALHLANMRGWLIMGDVTIGSVVAVTVTVFLYLQLSHPWPLTIRYVALSGVVLLMVLAAGLQAKQSAVGWARATAGTCLTEALSSPQAVETSYAGASTGLSVWETGVFVDASAFCALGIALGALAYVTARRVARA